MTCRGAHESGVKIRWLHLARGVSSYPVCYLQPGKKKGRGTRRPREWTERLNHGWEFGRHSGAANPLEVWSALLGKIEICNAQPRIELAVILQGMKSGVTPSLALAQIGQVCGPWNTGLSLPIDYV